MNYSAQQNGRIYQKIQNLEFSQKLQSVAFSQRQDSETISAGASAVPSPPGSMTNSKTLDSGAMDQPRPGSPKSKPSELLGRTGAAMREAQASKPVAERPGLAAAKMVRTGKTLTGDEPAFTNPLLLDKILAQLQFPAEIRQQCVASLQKRGSLSVDELFSALAGTASAGPRESAPPVVSASDVQELIDSIKMGGSNSMAGLTDLNLKRSGAYTLDEFRDLLRPLTQTRRLEAASKAARRGGGPPVAARESQTENPNTTSVAAAPEGQLERLSASRLPSFAALTPGRPSRMHRSHLPVEQQRDVQQAVKDSATTDSVDSETRSLPAFNIPLGPGAGAFLGGWNPKRLDPALASAIPERPSTEGPLEEASFPTPPVQAPASKPADSSLTIDQGTLNRQGSPPGGIQEQGPGSVTVSSMPVDVLKEDGSDPMEGLADNAFDFKVESLSGGESFDGSDGKDLGSSTPRQQDRGSDPGGLEGGRDPVTAAGPSRWRGEKVFNVVSAAGGIDNQPIAEAQAERINISRPDWTQRLCEQVLDRARSGRSSLEVEFDPQDLGRMTLRIETNQRQVTAWISTRSEEARVLLLQNASALQKQLAEHGLSLGQLTVNVSDGRGGARGNVDHRNHRRTSKIGARPVMEQQGAAIVPGIHGRLVGQGGSQTISLVV